MKWYDKRMEWKKAVHNSKDKKSKYNVTEAMQHESRTRKMLCLIKPDKMEMVKNIMSNYKA